jgi:hypothetical protein
LEQQGAHDVIGGSDEPLGFAILGRGVWAGQAEANTVFSKIIMKRVSKEFAPIVTLQAFNSNLELSGNIMEKTLKSNTSVRFITQRKGP